MVNNPIPFVVEGGGAPDSAPAGSIPISLYTDASDVVVLGVLDFDETPPSAGVWLRRPAPGE